MRLLNCCCGGVRPQDPKWVNLDDLHAQFPKGPERDQLNKEVNYVNHNVLIGPLPFRDESFDGALLAHALEHFDATWGLKLLIELRRVLKKGGDIVVSVPDASYFRKVHELDINQNWPDIFGISDPKNPIPTFFEAALWFDQHLAILTEDAVWAYLRRAGFKNRAIQRVNPEYIKANPASVDGEELSPFCQMLNQLDRLEFSLVMHATK